MRFYVYAKSLEWPRQLYLHNNNVVDTEYFLIFKEKNPDVIQKRIRALINGFSVCGLNSSQTTNDDLRIILDNFLNGGMTTEFGTVMSI